MRETASLATTVAERRRTESRRLSQTVRGDLDWIVMKCLEKDRNRRYETTNGLARDIERHLSNEPVQACPPSAMYRFSRFARRNTGPIAAVTTVIVALAIGLGISTWLFVKEREARKAMLVAEEEKRRVESVERAQIYARAKQWEKAAAEFAFAISRRPDDHELWYISAPLWLQFGDMESYRGHRREMLHRFADASDPMVAERTVKVCLLAPIARADLAPLLKLAERATTGTERNGLYEYFLLAAGMVQYRAGNFKTAITMLERISRPAPHRRPNLLIPVNFVLAMARHHVGQSVQAQDNFERAELILKANMLPRLEYPDLGDGWHDLLICLILHREASVTVEKSGSPNLHEDIAPALIPLRRARAFKQVDQYREAAAEYDKALELLPTSAVLNNEVAWFLVTCPDMTIRDPERAVKLAQKSLELRPDDGAIWHTLAVAQYRSGEWKTAIESLNKSIQMMSGSHESHVTFFLAMAHWQLGHKNEARELYRQAVAWMEKNAPTNEELLRFRAEAAEVLAIPQPDNQKPANEAATKIVNEPQTNND